MNDKVFRKITETKYLAAENAHRYRAIMRCFYENDQKYLHWMKGEEVHEQLSILPQFHDYTLDMLKQDLNALVEWGNLYALQDVAKVASYQQFMNKQYRYQMTEYSLEIERLTVKLENLHFESGSLEPKLLERIKLEIQKIPEMSLADELTVGSWWSLLTGDFQRLMQSYQSYIRDWNSAKADELMKTQGFMLYKEKLVDYLRSFVQELQLHSYEIEKTMKSFDRDALRMIFDKIAAYELSIPRTDAGMLTPDEIERYIEDKYMSMRRFFTSEVGRPSEVERVLSMTNEIIRKITRYAALIMELSSQHSSRREEYARIAEMFARTPDLDSAHLLSSHVFGIDAYTHLVGELERETENIQSSIHAEAPMVFTLKPRVRTFRERIQRTGIVDRTEEKEAMRKKILEERLEEETLLKSYMESGEVRFEGLVQVPEKVRRTLMRWLAKGIQEQGEVAVTEHGARFRLKNPKETRRCRFHSEDGTFDMPAFVLAFEDE